MPWTSMRTVTDNVDTVLASDINNIRGNILMISPDGVVHTLVQQASAPSAPAAGLVAIYAKTDGSVYMKVGPSGSEQSLGNSGSSKALLLMGA